MRGVARVLLAEHGRVVARNSARIGALAEAKVLARAARRLTDDVDEDGQNRYSLVWEHSPIEFLQLRLGVRVYDGIPQNDEQNRETAFLELHGYF